MSDWRCLASMFPLRAAAARATPIQTIAARVGFRGRMSKGEGFRSLGHDGGMSQPSRGRRLPRGGPLVLIGALVTLLAATACTSPAPAPASSPSTSTSASPGARPTATGPIVPTRSTLHWHACSGETAEQGIHDCTTISVPLSYADPGGRHITLALDMIPATAPASQQQGIMLVNPGGPGGSGLSLAPGVAQGLSSTVAADY